MTEFSLPEPRRWQSEAIEKINNHVFAGKTKIVVQAPVGAGKTLFAAYLFVDFIKYGLRPVFAVPDLSLIEQTIRAFQRVGIQDIGVIQGDHSLTNHGMQVQIASIQTLARRKHLPKMHMIVWDECHVMYKSMLKRMKNEWSEHIVIGLSATPWSRGMADYWDTMVIGSTIQELIEEGVLCPFRVYRPNVRINRRSIPVVKENFDVKQSSTVMSSSAVVADVVEQWRRHWGRGNVFMFCCDRVHAMAQMQKFTSQGVPFGYIDGEMSIGAREKVLDDYRSGKIVGISSVRCLSRGVDEIVHCIIDAQPSYSEKDYVQKIGRGLRRDPSWPEKELVILDHAGNAMDHGYVSDIHHTSLLGGQLQSAATARSRKKKSGVKECEHCNAVVRMNDMICPICGGSILKPKVSHSPGELVEMSPEDHGRHIVMADRQQWYSGLLWIGRERGYKEGWAAYMYRQKFNEWPNGLKRVAMEPIIEVRRYETYQRIKKAKAKAKADRESGDNVSGTPAFG